MNRRQASYLVDLILFENFFKYFQIMQVKLNIHKLSDFKSKTNIFSKYLYISGTKYEAYTGIEKVRF